MQSLVLFRVDLLTFTDGKVGPLSFDLFSSIVFLVAGQAVGILIQGAHRSARALYDRIKSGREDRMAFLEEYARVRINSTAEEKIELDSVDGQCDFLISTAIILLLIGIYYVATQKIEPIVVGLLFGVSAIFFANGYLEWEEGYSPIYDALSAKYNANQD